ncbi:trans-2-enoyl-CoA reductase-like protein [Tirmania nivea]|nr:trans-2-enoyl-CoA reductase-like protein [Tirmania nivea]
MTMAAFNFFAKRGICHLLRCSPTTSAPPRRIPAIILAHRTYVTLFGYTQAKALVYSKHGQPKEVLNLHSHSVSPPHGSTLNVKLLASPINPADINQIEGVYPSKPPFTQLLGTSTPSAVAGNEGLCEVISVGNQITNFKPGDRAIFRTPCFGTWRTHAAILDEKLLIKVPSDIPILSAATVSVNPCTGYRLLADFWGEGGLQQAAISGEWVIQNGANSGVGRAVIQMAKIWNLKTINVVRGNRSPEELTKLRNELREMGANEVITDEELSSKEIKEKITILTGGRGVGLGLNCVGGRATTDMARNLRHSSTIVTYGAMARQPVTIPASLFIFRNLSLRGFWVSEWAKGKDAEKEKMLEEIFGWIRKGWVKDVPMETINWTEESKKEELVGAVMKAGEGTGAKKVFVFRDV